MSLSMSLSKSTKSHNLHCVKPLDFSVELLRSMANADTNIVFSPIGIQMAFSMLLLGADAETKVELKRSLEIKMSAGDDEWQKAFAVLLNSLRKDGDKMFVMATRIYLDTKVPVDNRYKQALQKIYHLDPAQLNFGDPSKSAKAINSAMSVMTQGKFQTVIDLGRLKPGMDLVLVNAVYFRGIFKVPFTRGCTKEAPFRLMDGGCISVPMMSISDILPAFEESSGSSSVQVVNLPFYQSVFSLTVLLTPASQFATYERILTPEKVQLYMKSLNNTLVNLKLPRFKIRSKFDMNGIMKNLGASSVFDPNSADLSGICVKKQITLNYAVHQALFSVDEDGVEANASAQGGGASGGPANRSMTVTCDRPFFVWIWDSKHSSILLLARVIQP